MKIAIFGGSFDPIHNGHVGIVKQSLKQLDIDRIIIIPTYISAFKSRYYLNPVLRYKMVKKTFSSFKNIVVSDIETKKKRDVKTYESVLEVQKRFSPSKIYLIVGADNIESIHLWSDYKKLCNKVQFVVAPRDKIKIKNKYIALRFLNKNSSSKIRGKNSIKHIPQKAKLMLATTNQQGKQ